MGCTPCEARARAAAEALAPLGVEQRQALLRFAQLHGRTWKDSLRAVWDRSDPRTDDEAIVYALRNTHGPRWLLRFKLAGEARRTRSSRRRRTCRGPSGQFRRC
jgi:hypothetical protein